MSRLFFDIPKARLANAVDVSEVRLTCSDV